MCWTATRKLACLSEKTFFFPCGIFFPLFFGRMASVMRLRLGLFALARLTFQSSTFQKEGENLNLTATTRLGGGGSEALTEDTKR